jgi:hypothetical protein
MSFWLREGKSPGSDEGSVCWQVRGNNNSFMGRTVSNETGPFSFSIEACQKKELCAIISNCFGPEKDREIATAQGYHGN